MPYLVCKTFEIESGHLLSKHPAKCRFPHGHSRKIEVVLAADTLDRNDMVCDFRAIKELLKSFLDAWDHALCLNTEDPNFGFFQRTYGPQVIPFVRTDPTSEVMARAIFDELKTRLAAAQSTPPAAGEIPPGVRVVRVRIGETSSSWAEYSE